MTCFIHVAVRRSLNKSELFLSFTHVNFGILASKIKNLKGISPYFRRKYSKTPVARFYHFFFFHQCLTFVAKLYLSPHFLRFKAIKSISVPHLSANSRKNGFRYTRYLCLVTMLQASIPQFEKTIKPVCYCKVIDEAKKVRVRILVCSDNDITIQTMYKCCTT